MIYYIATIKFLACYILVLPISITVWQALRRDFISYIHYKYDKHLEGILSRDEWSTYLA